MQLNISDDAVINEPLDLANALGEYLLIVDNATVAEGTQVPETTLVRYERDKQLLFIDSRVITWLGLEATMKVWRKSEQYAGVQPKRLTSNSGRTEKPANALCFDLLENPRERVDPIRPRRGRPLKAERTKIRLATLDAVNHDAVNILREIAAIKRDYPDDRRIENVLDKAKAILDNATDLLAKGRAPQSKKRKARVKTENIKIVKEQRIRVVALDETLKEAMPKIHRVMKRSIMVDGRPKWEEKEIRPDGDPDTWIGKYEDITTDKGVRTKLLYLPVGFLKAMSELRRDYMRDFRYVRKIPKHMNYGTVYVAVFDMDRKENVDTTEDQSIVYDTLGNAE